MNDRPKVGTGVCIIKDNKVLMGQRKNTAGDGTWCFPGGHLEFGETLEDCAIREVKEETGLEIQNIWFAGISNAILEKENKQYVTIFMISDYKSGELKTMEPDKFERWDWFELDVLPNPIFLPLDNFLKQNKNLEHIITNTQKGTIADIKM